jgi:hypothetical protein
MCKLNIHPEDYDGIILIQVWCHKCGSNNNSMNTGCRTCGAYLCKTAMKRARTFNKLKLA